MSVALSSRARVGLIVPPNNTVNEAEWAAFMPPGVSFHCARFHLNPASRSSEEIATLKEGLAGACGLLAEADLDAIAFGCTAPSAINPRRDMETWMQGITKQPCVTAAAAVVDALVALGVRKVALLSPFSGALTEHEANFMRGEGLEVVATHSLGHQTYAPGRKLEIHRIPPKDVAATAMGLDLQAAEALVLSGTNLVTMEVIAELEAALGLPVVSSNQATLWSTLRKARIDDRLPLGRLFAVA
jgi:maleate cis-trans isomerase